MFVLGIAVPVESQRTGTSGLGCYSEWPVCSESDPTLAHHFVSEWRKIMKRQDWSSHHPYFILNLWPVTQGWICWAAELRGTHKRLQGSFSVFMKPNLYLLTFALVLSGVICLTLRDRICCWRLPSLTRHYQNMSFKKNVPLSLGWRQENNSTYKHL